MKKLLDEQTAEQVKEIFAGIKNSISLVYFTKNECENCNITGQLLNELNELSDSINLTVHNISENEEIKEKFNIEDAPSYLLLNLDNEQVGSTFYGVPAGHEFNTLITNIIDASDDQKFFEKETLEKINKITKPIDIKVFVTTSCPHCPGAAINASRLAQLNPNITATIYEAQTFGEIAEKYTVSSVPKIVINEANEFLGNQPIEEFLKVIEKI